MKSTLWMASSATLQINLEFARLRRDGYGVVCVGFRSRPLRNRPETANSPINSRYY